MKCEICGCDANHIRRHVLRNHLDLDYKIDYYDKYLKTPEDGKCCICGAETKWNKTEYRKTCSYTCSRKLAHINAKKTFLANYGTDNPAKADIVKAKIAQTNLDKYGCVCTLQSEESKEKTKNTYMTKCGYEHYMQNPETKLKRAAEWSLKTEAEKQSIYDKAKQTRYDKNDGKYESAETTARRIKTCQEKFNGNAPACSADVQNKMQNTSKEHLGVSFSAQAASCQEKRINTCLIRYNAKSPIANPICREKYKNTCLEKYDVDHPMKNYEVFCKTKHRYEYDGIKFDSRPEIELYKKLKAEHADFEYQPNVYFEYEFAGKKHRYYPDFRIGDEYVELKGSHFFDENGKMINPFDRSQDELYEAKHQCMIENAINILLV